MIENDSNDTSHKVLRTCFDGGGCGQCGACCEFPFGFDVPTVSAVKLLQVALQEKEPPQVDFTSMGPRITIQGVSHNVATQFKTVLGCPHHERIGDISRCTIWEVRKAFPGLFVNCNGFNGGAGEGVTKNSRGKLRKTSNKQELSTFIIDTLFTPGQYSIFLLETAHKNYLLKGELDAIVPELQKALKMRMEYHGGGFFDALCSGYITGMKNTNNLGDLVKWMRDFGLFLERNRLHTVVEEHFNKHKFRSHIAITRAQMSLLFMGRAGDVFLQSFFPFKFPRKMEYCTDEHRGMVC